MLEPSAGVSLQLVDAVLENKPDADIMAFEKGLMKRARYWDTCIPTKR